jgi:hydrogenase expression/formation protein HypC
MCLGIPGQIVAFVDEQHELARADVNGVRRVINVDLVRQDGLEVGDWVLIHVGFAISRIDEDEAHRTTELLRELGESYARDLRQLSRSEIE